MAREPSTFIKLDRNILEWGWYKEPNTFRVFIHLLLKANVEERDFLGHEIKRGELAISYRNLAKELGISTQSVRTALSHLQLTHEITLKSRSKFSIISILRYDDYQRKQHTTNTLANTQPTHDQQQYKNNKNDKEEYIYTGPAGNVMLTDLEMQKLDMIYGPEEMNRLIADVSYWLSKGNHSDNHFETIRYFAKRQKEQAEQSRNGSVQNIANRLDEKWRSNR